jgi:hypothetical protein
MQAASAAGLAIHAVMPESPCDLGRADRSRTVFPHYARVRRPGADAFAQGVVPAPEETNNGGGHDTHAGAVVPAPEGHQTGMGTTSRLSLAAVAIL